MTRALSTIFIASILAAACGGGDATPAAAAPTATRGYLPAPATLERHEAPVAPPRPAEPLDPASVGPDQPENVQVTE